MPTLIPITDFSAPELDVYSRLSETQLLHYYEPNGGIFIAESPKVIDRALNAGYMPLSLLAEDKCLRQYTESLISRCGNIPIYTASLAVLTKLTGYHLTGGMLCAMSRRPLPKAEELCSHKRRIAILEHIMNPTNIGAIIRSAAALGMEALLLTPPCSDPLYRRAIRVSMGTVFQIPWTYLEEELPDGITFLRQSGFQTAAMALEENSISIEDPRLSSAEKLAVVLGSEGEGLSPSTIASCDYTVRIPMFHGVDSLNVAAASAVAFWQLRAPDRKP